MMLWLLAGAIVVNACGLVAINLREKERRTRVRRWVRRWVKEDALAVWGAVRKWYAYDRRIVLFMLLVLVGFAVLAAVVTTPLLAASPFVVAYFAPMPYRQHHKVRFKRACRTVNAAKNMSSMTWQEIDGPGAGRRAVPWTAQRQVPHLENSVRTPIGRVADVVGAPGMTIPHLVKHRDELASALGLRDVHVEENDDDKRLGHIILTERDPFPKDQKVPWPGMTLERTSIWDEIDFGVDRFGEPIRFALPYRNMLFGGIPDAGKSAAERVPLAHVALDPTVPLFLFDGGDVDMYPFKACVDASVEGAYVGPEPEEAVPVLEHLVDEINKRMRIVRGNSIDEWRDKIAPGQEPAIYVVIGEWASYLDRCGNNGALRNRFNRAMRLIVANGRKLLIITSASTQKPSFDIIPTNIRDLFAYRMALRCTTSSMSDMILGDWSEKGFDASKILPHQPGTGLLHVDGSKPTLVRAAFIDSDDVRGVARAGADLRARYVAEQLGRPAPAPAGSNGDRPSSGADGSRLEQGVSSGSEGLTASGRNVSLQGSSRGVKGVWTVDGQGAVDGAEGSGAEGSGADAGSGSEGSAADAGADAGSSGDGSDGSSAGASGGGADVPPPADADVPPAGAVDDGVRVTGRLRRGKRR